MISGTFWGPDFNNAGEPASSSTEFEKKFKRIPSQYAAQSYDAALLLDSAIAKVKGNVADKKAFQAALKAADFKSRARRLQVQQQQLPGPGPARVRGGQGRQGPRELKTIAHAAQGSPGRLSRDKCKMK